MKAYRRTRDAILSERAGDLGPSAVDDIDYLLGRTYLIYRGAQTVSAVLRTVAHPEYIARPHLNRFALAINIGTGIGLAGRLRQRGNLRSSSVAASEATTASCVLISGATCLSRIGWDRGAAWPGGQYLWSAAGIGMSETKPVRLTLELLVHFGSLVVSRSRVSNLTTTEASGLLTSALAFFVAGRAPSSGMRRRAIEIDRAADLVAEQQTAASISSEEVRLREEVLARTAETLRLIDSLVESHPARAAQVADDEERRLRVWLNGNAELLESAPDLDAAAAVDNAELRVTELIRWLESTYRILSAALLATSIVRERENLVRRNLSLALASAAVAHAGTVSYMLLFHSERLSRHLVGCSDVALAVLTSMLERSELGADQRRGFLLSYGVSLGVPAGLIDGRRLGESPYEVAIGLIRALFAAAETGPRWRRRTGAVDELVVTVSGAWVARWFTRVGVRQARELTERLTVLAMQRAKADLAAARLRNQAFVHDGAVQVLMWIGKTDLSRQQLRNWISQELPRVELAASGVADAPPSSLDTSVHDLIAGFEQLGMTISSQIGPVPVLTSDSNSAVVEIINEALTNVFKHTPTRTATVRMATIGGDLTVSVSDQGGVGVALPGAGFGTRTMAGLAEQIGSTVTWCSNDAGGTVVTLRLPLATRVPPGSISTEPALTANERALSR